MYVSTVPKMLAYIRICVYFLLFCLYFGPPNVSNHWLPLSSPPRHFASCTASSHLGLYSNSDVGVGLFYLRANLAETKRIMDLMCECARRMIECAFG